MCEKYERCQHTSSTRKFKKIERGVKLCAGRNTTCLATAQQAVCILLAAQSCCGHAIHGERDGDDLLMYGLHGGRDGDDLLTDCAWSTWRDRW